MEFTKDHFADHVALIMKQEGVSQNRAKFLAWLEGPKGYTRRMEG